MSNLYSGTPNQHAIKYINAPYIFAGRKKTNIFSPEKYSPLKPLGHMNRNFRGSIYWRFTIKIAHFVSIRDEMGTLYRGSSIDASYQVSVHMAK
jgi:hypothetical protein